LGWSDFAAIVMLAPSRANRKMISLPMPRLPPVMNTVLFAQLAMVFPFVCQSNIQFNAP
jgi:hypothetical protein